MTRPRQERLQPSEPVVPALLKGVWAWKSVATVQWSNRGGNVSNLHHAALDDEAPIP